ncbi:MAG TPA: TetR/AcrR family transcriptional regulator [Streptosporangiaceae bacterium]|nr:TetR/AcrR family transcriptional regulator [Streptosporangiaceae bacterium]
MPRADKGGRYHHGDLRAALIDTAIEIIGERGVHGFSMAEATRRLGVAVSAPYAHFADRDALLVAVAVHAYQLFSAELLPQTDAALTPVDRLAAMARGYVRFAATHRPLFDLLYDASLDKAKYPELEEAERPINEGFSACVLAIAGDDKEVAEDLATAVEATAHGLVTLLLDGEYDAKTVEGAADRAARVTLALVESRHLLSPPPPLPSG